MSVLSNFEGKVEGAMDGAAAAMFSSPIEPAQIAKKAEKQMKREKLVGSGRQYAPTLYNVLVNERDDERLFGFYPTMATEIENYLYAKGTDAGMEFDTRPLVRFISDPGLKKGRFDVIAEVVSAPIIKKLRAEELEYYGLAPEGAASPHADSSHPAAPASPENQKNNNSAYSAVNSNSKFAGLNVAVDINDIPEISEPQGVVASPSITPHAHKNEARSSDSGLGSRKPAPSSESSVRSPEADSSNPDDQAVIGQAGLFNRSEQRQHRLEKRKLTAGRSKDNDIVLADANASRVHVRFSQDATGKWKVTDLGSTNGTLLNDRTVSSAILKSGDEITIGTTVLQFIE